MEAKLIKSEEGYSLIDLKGNLIAQTFGKFRGKKLSTKNCQAIERGYDLDELSKDIFPDSIIFNDFWVDGKYESEEFNLMPYQWGFKVGFQKALEILGDKKFSEEDVKNIFAKTLENAPSTESHTRMISDVEYRHFVMDELYGRITKSLQQTEWDVEVEMEWDPKSTRCDECGEGGNYMNTPCDHPHDCNHWSAKYDSENCLILKRI